MFLKCIKKKGLLPYLDHCVSVASQTLSACGLASTVQVLLFSANTDISSRSFFTFLDKIDKYRQDHTTAAQTGGLNHEPAKQ
ncbi:hypothetical protein E2C01_037845 [Portunus trituberculatus]|uniref:Uncharacterized protein n=1 Tax=Portunus trituberculatus TaxID=210409 RepID=A0A5B7F979_PORTR|nr:hypothetical protein [Portunus trituberculatus]